jgi:Tol biopolymer transport system component
MPHKLKKTGGNKFFAQISSLALLFLLGGLALAACGSNEPQISLSLATPQPGMTPGATSGSSTTDLTLATTTAAATTRAASTTAAVAATSAARTTAAATTRAASTTAAARATSTPPPSLTPPNGLAGKLTVLSPERALYILRFDGSAPQMVLGKLGNALDSNNNGVVYDWPMWSKDGSKLAVMAYNVKGGDLDTFDVLVMGADGKNPYKVRDTSPDSPIFMSWSPDGSQLSLLSSSSARNQFELHLIESAQPTTPQPGTGRKVAEGSSIYTGWSPDGQQLSIHAGSASNNAGTVAVLAAKDVKAVANALKNTPGTFRSPAFSSDSSRLAYVVRSTQTSNDDVMIQDKAGTNIGTLETAGKGVSLSWSPTGQKLAYTYIQQSAQSVIIYKGITLAELDVPAPAGAKFATTPIVDEPVLAFFWSPDGKKLAYIGIDQQEFNFVWKVYDFATRKSTKLNDWLPSRSMSQIIQYFDQYSQGNSLWSPDSKMLVWSGLTKTEYDAIDENSSDDIITKTYIVPVEGADAGKPTAVAYGMLAFWSR